MALVTVYLPCSNYGRFLSDAIDSVLKQTFDDWELFIIDDGSIDNTSEVLQLYKGHPRITIFTTPSIGLPSVCNFAISRSLSKYVIRLDGDDIFDENILLILTNYLERHPDAALVFPDYYLIDEFGIVFAHEQRQRIFENNHMLDIPPNGACTMIRKSIIDDIGGYREDLGAQDGFDLWTRIRNKYVAGNINLPLFRYRRHGSNLTGNTHRILSARRQIKKDAVESSLLAYYPITAVIPCRRNYDFRQDLWNATFNGRSLLEKDIDVCLTSKLIDKVVVACDNLDAKKVVEKFDDSRVSFYLRDSDSTIRTRSIVPTLKNIVQSLDPQFKGITVLRYLQTPFVSNDVLDEAITSLIMNDADSSYGVERIKRNLFRRSPHGLEPINSNNSFSTDFDIIYRDSQTFTASANRNFLRGSLSGSTSVCFEVSESESLFINSELDLEVANLLSKKYD